MGERKIDVFESIYGKGEKAQLAHNAFIDSYLSRVNAARLRVCQGSNTYLEIYNSMVSKLH